jgi:hypothetical protein
MKLYLIFAILTGTIGYLLVERYLLKSEIEDLKNKLLEK